MGMVYEAYDRRRGERVAIKTMRRLNPSSLEQFRHEFRSLCDVAHPNLVNLYELIAVKDRWFFTMELVEGCDFASYVSARGEQTAAFDGVKTTDQTSLEGVSSQPGQFRQTEPGYRFDEIRVREAFRQLANGVDALHRRGKLHRDIKPTNAMVTANGRIVLIDFGLSVDLESNGTCRPTDGRIVGTLAHMSPEQAAGSTITTASDWYSVGVMLFEAMTGQLPFVGSSQDFVFAKLTQAAPPPGSLVAGLPDDLAELCVELLHRNPARRPKGFHIIERCSAGRPGRPKRPREADRGREGAGGLPRCGRFVDARLNSVICFIR
jgi:serine/threonine protein kinase